MQCATKIMHNQKYYAITMLINTDVAPSTKLTTNSFPRQDFFPDNFLILTDS